MPELNTWETSLPRVGLRPERKDYVIGMLTRNGDLLAVKPKGLFEETFYEGQKYLASDPRNKKRVRRGAHT